MSVVNGQIANQTTFNNAFMSRTAANTGTIAIVALQNTDSESGSFVDNLQKAINKLGEGVGWTGENDLTINVYANHNYITSGDNRKVAIGKLDAQLKATQDDLDAAETEITNHEARLDAAEGRLDSAEATLADHETRIDSAETTLTDHETRLDSLETGTMSIGGNKTFTGNTVFSGDVQMNGTTTFVNSTNMQVTDKNIEINQGGNDASAIGSGITVKRTTDHGALQFDSTLTSKWKVGLISAMYEIIVSGIAQTIVGLKSFVNGIATDTIAEYTLNAGVTVDGVLIKDGLVDGRDVSADYADHESRIDALEAAPSGGGGGVSLSWKKDTNAPLSEVIDGLFLESFDKESLHEMYALLCVPSNYTPGSPIKLKSGKFFCVSTTGKVLFRTVSALIRSTTVLGTYPNTHTSTNTEVTVQAVSNTINPIGDIDITDGTGQINGVAVAAGDKIRVKLFRNNAGESAPAVGDARLLIDALEPTFT